MKDLYHVACCPYCPADRGDIALDSSAIVLSRQASEGPSANSEPPRPLVLYNLAQADRQPCEHLVQLTGSIQVRGEQPPDQFCGAEFDWQAAELHHDHEAMSYLWERLIGQADGASVPPTSFTLVDVDRRCKVSESQGADGCMVSIIGSVIFAENVEQLLAELQSLAEVGG